MQCTGAVGFRSYVLIAFLDEGRVCGLGFTV